MRLAKPVTTGHPFVDSGIVTRIYGRLRRVCAVCDGYHTGAIHDRPFCEKRGWGWTVAEGSHFAAIDADQNSDGSGAK